MTVAWKEAASTPVDVTISDLNGQDELEFPQMDPATPVGDLIGMSRTRMELSPSVEWQIRDDGTARLLRRDQRIGEVATDGKVKLTMQPDARLA